MSRRTGLVVCLVLGIVGVGAVTHWRTRPVAPDARRIEASPGEVQVAAPVAPLIPARLPRESTSTGREVDPIDTSEPEPLPMDVEAVGELVDRHAALGCRRVLEATQNVLEHAPDPCSALASFLSLEGHHQHCVQSLRSLGLDAAAYEASARAVCVRSRERCGEPPPSAFCPPS